MLYILVGLPATGKSEVAKMLAAKTGASILSEDEILRELFPTPSHSREERQEVYDEMFKRAKKFLKSEKKVILDATFISRANRETARQIAKDAGVEYKMVEVTAPEDQIKKRLEKRYHPDGNDADWDVYLKYKRNFEPVFEHHPAFNNSGSLEKVREKLEEIFNE